MPRTLPQGTSSPPGARNEQVGADDLALGVEVAVVELVVVRRAVPVFDRVVDPPIVEEHPRHVLAMSVVKAGTRVVVPGMLKPDGWLDLEAIERDLRLRTDVGAVEGPL